MIRPRVINIVALCCGFAAFVVLVFLVPAESRHQNDFKHIYLGMHALLDGREPYSVQSLTKAAADHGLRDASLNPYVYLPYTGLSLAFLRATTFATAANIWFVINLIAILASAVCIGAICARVHCRRDLWPAWSGLALVLLSLHHGTIRTLTAGQLTLVQLLAIVGACWLLMSRRGLIAGALLAHAAMFKIAPAIFFVSLVTLRARRAAAAMTLGCVLLLVISLVAVGWSVHMDFIPMLRDMGYGRSTWQEYGAIFWKDPTNQSLNSFFTHIMVDANRVTLSWIQSTQATANLVTQLVTLALGVVFASLSWSTYQQSKNAPEPLSDLIAEHFALTLIFMLIVPSLLWDHYLVVLAFPVALLIARATRKRQYWPAILAIACHVATAVPIAFGHPDHRTGTGILVMSAKLWPTLVLFVLCAATLRGTLRARESASNESPESPTS